MKIAHVLLIVSLTLLTKDLFSQSANLSYFEVIKAKNVYFFSPTYPSTEGWIKILSDDGTPVYQNTAENMTTGWENFGNIKKPVGYVSGNTPIIGCDILYKCTQDIDLASYYLRAINPEGYNLPPQQIEVISGSYMRYKKQPTIKEFVKNTILGFDEFVLNWQIASSANAPESEWQSLTTTSSPVYVTYEKPKLLPLSWKNVPQFDYDDRYQHSLLKIGCNAANGIGTSLAAINGIWNDLKSLNVKSADDMEKLHYYDSYECVNTTTKNLLKTNDGQCGAWAKFFIDLLRTQGLSHSTENNDYFWIYHELNNNSNYGFFVKDWTFTSGQNFPSTPNSNGYKYLFVPEQVWLPGFRPDFSGWLANSQYNWEYKDGVDNTQTIAGQSNTNPESIFRNHQIVNIQNNLLDPSYGVDYTSIENEIVAGYFWSGIDIIDETDFGIDFNDNGMMETQAQVYVFYVTDDLTQFDLTGNFDNY